MIGTILLAADTGVIVTSWLVGIIIGGLVGFLIGRSKDRGALGLILGAILGCIGWVIIAIIPAKDRRV